jgi:hypothetical protein
MKARLPRVREKTVQAQIVQLLRSVGARVWITGTTRPRGEYQGTCMTPGLPDLIVFVPLKVLPAELLFVEVKAKGGRLRPGQLEFEIACRHAGVEHLVGDLDVVIAWLTERGLVRAEGVAHYRRGGV